MERPVAEGDVLLGEPVLGQLAGDEEPLGDAELFLLRVAGDLDDLHTVPQGREDRVDEVGRGDEHDVREVERDTQVVVAEGVVLFRVQDLQERGRGIATKVRADLVHLVHHEDRIVGAGLLDALDDAAGHGADIRPAVAPDLGLVPDAAQRDPHELPSQRPRDGLAQGGLADPGRPDEAEDRPLHFLLHLADGEVLQDPLLDLFQVVVVFVQNLRGRLDVEVVLGLLAPGQLHQPLEVGPDRGRFGGVRVHLLKALELLFGLLEDFLRHLGVFDVLPELGDLFGPLVQLAELFLNGLELLAQEVLPLGLVHLAFGLGLDLLLHREDFDLRRQELADAPEPRDRLLDLQDLLGGFHLEPEVRHDHVGEPARVLEVLDDDHHVRHQDLAQAHEPFELLFHGPHQGLALQGLALRFDLGKLPDAD